MAKIKAVLDQETWVEVDVPDEFQAILDSLFDLEPLENGKTDDLQTGAFVNKDSTTSGAAGPVVPQQELRQSDSADLSDVAGPAKSPPMPGILEKNKADISSSKDRGKLTTQSIVFKGVGYHMVNWLVISILF